MADDELSAPLGQNRKPKRRIRLPVSGMQALASVLGVVLLGCAVWALTVKNPLGGEPVAVIATGLDTLGADRALPKVVAGGAVQGPRSYDGPGGSPSKNASPEQSASKQSPATPPQSNAPDAKTVTIIDGSTGERHEVPIPAARDVQTPIDPRLLETARHGPLPRIAPDGTRPSEIYAHALSPAQAKRPGPRIAIVVGGLGVSDSITKEAIKQLPSAVTVAFLPYAAGIGALADSARAAGHDVLLQAPMEPFDYPNNDPGPQTLLTSAPADQNLDRLRWQMSQLQGYVGIVNYMGARFTSTEPALTPVLKEIARRGLIYVDDGSSQRSLAGQIAGANNVPFAQAEVTLDAVPTPSNIDEALARLEAVARDRGTAVGIASAMPVSIERIAHWAKDAEDRGFVLVPITTIANKPKSS